jgi:hypothetical protein
MKKIVVILLFIIGCNGKNEFSNANLKSISIYQFVHTKDKNNVITNISVNKVCTINNADSISFILSVLNSKHKEPAVFMPDYRIELNYTDTLIELSVNGKYLKINGRTFKVGKDLSKYCKSLQKH